MISSRLSGWIADLGGPSAARWYIKRLSRNDTHRSGGHQAGPYTPKSVVFRWLPELESAEGLNPRIRMRTTISSHDLVTETTAIWYNNRLHTEGGTRNEARITGWGGADSPVLDADATGSIAIFTVTGNVGARELHVWICGSIEEAYDAEATFGPIESRRAVEWPPAPRVGPRSGCALSRDKMPPEWLVEFPRPREILDRSISLAPQHNELAPDPRLVQRRECEHQLFESVEAEFWAPVVDAGFGSLGDMVEVAMTIIQRRRARSGRSLELHVERILTEEGFARGVSFDVQPRTELRKKPDFLFPSAAAYHADPPERDQLRMLAVKTTLKERWRQVLTEADQIANKHLLTLDVDVTEGQFAEMTAANLTLVVPTPLHRHYPASVRPHLRNLESFIAEARGLSA